MAFIQLAARRSMRDGLRCLAAAGSRLYHWGLKNVARSTFTDANNSRPVSFFQDLFGEMYALCKPTAPNHKFRFKSKLFSMDATTIKLYLSLFPWASFRQKKGGVKLHTVLDYNGYITVFVIFPMRIPMKVVLQEPWNCPQAPLCFLIGGTSTTHGFGYLVKSAFTS